MTLSIIIDPALELENGLFAIHSQFPVRHQFILVDC